MLSIRGVFMLSYVIAGLVFVFLLFLFSRFRPAPTKKVTDDLYAVRCGFVNFYVLKTDNGVIQFDTGMSPFFAKRGLQKLGISPDVITHIFLTHTDYDHVGGLAAFPQAMRYISKPEEQMINGKTARRGVLHNRKLSNYHLLEDGDTVSVGNYTIKVHFVPGHTPGSVVYVIGNRYLVSGDLLRVSRKKEIIPFLWFMNMNHRQVIESMKKVQSVIRNVEYVLTGHTGFCNTKSNLELSYRGDN